MERTPAEVEALPLAGALFHVGDSLMWRSWIEHPPQIPWAPVIITNRTYSKPLDAFQAMVCKNWIPPEFNIANLAWRPTGIYREEFYQVTGRWE